MRRRIHGHTYMCTCTFVFDSFFVFSGGAHQSRRASAENTNKPLGSVLLFFSPCLCAVFVCTQACRMCPSTLLSCGGFTCVHVSKLLARDFLAGGREGRKGRRAMKIQKLHSSSDFLVKTTCTILLYVGAFSSKAVLVCTCSHATSCHLIRDA